MTTPSAEAGSPLERDSMAPWISAENRVRFTCGYWDGVADKYRHEPKRCFETHLDAAYRQGYLLGYSDSAVKKVKQTSDEAWQFALQQGYVTDDRAG